MVVHHLQEHVYRTYRCIHELIGTWEPNYLNVYIRVHKYTYAASTVHVPSPIMILPRARPIVVMWVRLTFSSAPVTSEKIKYGRAIPPEGCSVSISVGWGFRVRVGAGVEVTLG
eukprot:1339468-Amorphochlora_amoeboformis.AAC.1